MRPALCLLLLLPSAVFCLSDGELVDWNDRAYMVKVVSTVQEEGEEKYYGCTGVMLTSELVLTSSKCFQSSKEDEKQAVVISIRGNGTRTWKRLADVEVADEYALLSINRKRKDPCLSFTGVPRFERLSLSEDMFKPMWTAPEAEELFSKNCRIVGFESAHPDNYTTSNNVFQATVILEKDVDGMIMTVMDSGKAPCYDDYGIPLECEMKEDEWTLVGMVQAMIREAPKEKETPADFCNMINGARFSLLDDPKLNDLLKAHLTKIIGVQKTCFSGKKEEGTSGENYGKEYEEKKEKKNKEMTEEKTEEKYEEKDEKKEEEREEEKTEEEEKKEEEKKEEKENEKGEEKNEEEPEEKKEEENSKESGEQKDEEEKENKEKEDGQSAQKKVEKNKESDD